MFCAPVFVVLGSWWVFHERLRPLQLLAIVVNLLGFALVSCLFRTGAYAMRLEPALYALPLMLGAISCVHASRRLAPYEPDRQRLALMRLGGYALTALAFALSPAHPPAHLHG